MGFFKTDNDFYDVVAEFFRMIQKNSDMGPKLGGAGIVIRFKYTDPDCQITVDCKNTPKEEGTHFSVYTGDNELQPDVLMTMTTDIAHKFWLGKVNLLTAVARRQIIVKGPFPKIIKLLPIIKPTYKMYPEFLKQKGKDELLA